MPRDERIKCATAEEFARAIATAPNIASIEDLAERERLLDLQDLVTSSVEFIRSVFPNQLVNGLGVDLWSLIEYGWTPVSVGPVPTIHFVVVRAKADKGGIGGIDGLLATIMIPVEWADMLCRDRLMQIGGLIFAGSQAIDFYNDRIAVQQTHSRDRARAWEAEYLSAALLMSPGVALNQYQQDVLKLYPKGLSSLDPRLRYDRKKVLQRPASKADRPGRPHAQ